MKNFWVILFMAWLIFCFTSTTFATVSHKYFRADKQYYDAETGTYTISGNIVINVGNGTIIGDKAMVKLSTMEFWGTGGWLLQQEDVTFRGEKVYVVLDNNAAMIEGGADFQRANLQITSDRVEYNWKTRIAEFKGNVKVTREGGLIESLDPVKYNVKTKEFVK